MGNTIELPKVLFIYAFLVAHYKCIHRLLFPLMSTGLESKALPSSFLNFDLVGDSGLYPCLPEYSSSLLDNSHCT